MMCILMTSVEALTIRSDCTCFWSTLKPPKWMIAGLARTQAFCDTLEYISEK
jgi:hypothetical protein